MAAATWTESRAALRQALNQALRGPWVPPRLGRAPYLWLVSLAFFGWKYFYVPPSVLELAAILLSTAAVALLVDLPLSFLMPTLAAGTPVGIATIMDARVQRSREQLLKKQEEVEHLARIAERERISRDMHDLLGHTLSLITLKAELVQGNGLRGMRERVEQLGGWLSLAVEQGVTLEPRLPMTDSEGVT